MSPPIDPDDHHARQRIARAETEPGFGKPNRKRELDEGPIEVRFDGNAWCVDDSSLDEPQQYAHLADAEARASELSKDTGHSVRIRGQDGELIAAYSGK